ncbi:MAG: hypothetical protein R2684_05430 [Pyrinomonadaceae bacterium]
MTKKLFSVALLLVFFSHTAFSQETEVKITLSEQFFDALFEAVFTNLEQPKVPIASTGAGAGERGESARGPMVAGDALIAACDETVRLRKDVEGVRTAVKFRNGKIVAPIAFEGSYDVPLFGCVDFSGWADTNIDLKFDKAKNALVGDAKVLNVNLSGTGGTGSSLIARMVQNSIDKKVNPLEIIALDRLSFTAPVQNAGKLRMEAVGMRHVVGEKEISVFLKYRFKKG